MTSAPASKHGMPSEMWPLACRTQLLRRKASSVCWPSSKHTQVP